MVFGNPVGILLVLGTFHGYYAGKVHLSAIGKHTITNDHVTQKKHEESTKQMDTPFEIAQR